MPRPIGLPKTGGRKKGTPNRKSTDLQVLLEEKGLDVPARIVELIPLLPTQEQVKTLLDLMSYLYPKRKATEAVISAAQEHQSGDSGGREKFLKALFADPELSDAAIKIGELEAEIYSQSNAT